MLRNQGVQASQWGEVEAVVAECGARVLKLVTPSPHTPDTSPDLRHAPRTSVLSPPSSSSSLSTSNLSKSDQLLTTHRSPLTDNQDLTYRHPKTDLEPLTH